MEVPPEIIHAVVSNCLNAVLPTAALLNSAFRAESERLLYRKIEIKWLDDHRNPDWVLDMLRSAIKHSSHVREFIADFRVLAPNTMTTVEEKERLHDPVALVMCDSLAAFSALQKLHISASPANHYAYSDISSWMNTLEETQHPMLTSLEISLEVCGNPVRGMSWARTLPALRYLVFGWEPGYPAFKHSTADLSLLSELGRQGVICTALSVEGMSLNTLTMYPVFMANWSAMDVKSAIMMASTASLARLTTVDLFVASPADLSYVFMEILEHFPQMDLCVVRIQESWTPQEIPEDLGKILGQFKGCLLIGFESWLGGQGNTGENVDQCAELAHLLAHSARNIQKVWFEGGIRFTFEVGDRR
ncbi:hypothetical protein C8J56DRAFT_951716 [Mycena floridula]|nr:hypothetical protein C8J56DRAFT_951704 [Mycena floridula]KAJ7583747.1 hypothetical protein C8J56DRAFT_951716 [Mycena floridula]